MTVRHTPIRARFFCASVTETASEINPDHPKIEVVMTPVMEDTEDRIDWSKTVVSGVLKMNIVDSAYRGKFVAGQQYYLDIVPVEVNAAQVAA